VDRKRRGKVKVNRLGQTFDLDHHVTDANSAPLGKAASLERGQGAGGQNFLAALIALDTFEAGRGSLNEATHQQTSWGGPAQLNPETFPDFVSLPVVAVIEEVKAPKPGFGTIELGACSTTGLEGSLRKRHFGKKSKGLRHRCHVV
jgi:hypothetical protein